VNILVNGEKRDVPEGTSVHALLEQFELNGKRIAVERNGTIVKKNGYASTFLGDGDTLEVVRFVGGG
jgi:sulfur carrier protein